jgi:hypothetical protein
MGRILVGEDGKPGRSSTSTNDDYVKKVRAGIRGNRRLTVREVAGEVSISIEYWFQIFTENLQMRRFSAKFVPRLLTDRKRTVLKSVRTCLSMQQSTHFSELSPSRHFPVSQTSNNIERTSYPNHSEKREKRTARHYGKCVPGAF